MFPHIILFQIIILVNWLNPILLLQVQAFIFRGCVFKNFSCMGLTGLRNTNSGSMKLQPKIPKAPEPGNSPICPPGYFVPKGTCALDFVNLFYR